MLKKIVTKIYIYMNTDQNRKAFFAAMAEVTRKYGIKLVSGIYAMEETDELGILNIYDIADTDSRMVTDRISEKAAAWINEMGVELSEGWRSRESDLIPGHPKQN